MTVPVSVKTKSDIRWSSGSGTLYAQRDGKEFWVEVWRTDRGWNAVCMRDEPLRYGREWKEWNPGPPFLSHLDGAYFACVAAERFLGIKKPELEVGWEGSC